MKLDFLNTLDADAILKELGSTKADIAKALADIKIPNKKSEKYRYFDIQSVVSRDLELLTTQKSDFEKSGNRVVIKDAQVVSVPKSSDVEVEIGSFDGVDLEHFDGLYFASHLMAQNLIVIKIKGDVKFEISHNFSANSKLINYRVVVLTKPNSHSRIYETFNDSSNESIVLSGYDIALEKDATLEFIKSQTVEGTTTPIFINAYSVKSSADLKLRTFDFANSNMLNVFRASLYKNANFDATHLLYTNKECKAGTVSEIVHLEENTHSNQNAKNILNDKSRGIFDALIKVTNGGKGTVAHQNSKSILLNSGAYMASKPQLEIYIDDLEASHGSTTGQLDEKALFYLRSRGIREVEARKMLILAFANEAISEVGDEAIAGHIYVDFEKAYYGNAELDCIKTCHSCEDMVLGANSENN